MSKELEAVNAEIASLKSQLTLLIARHDALQRERERLESVEFITKNKIQRSSVQMSSGEGLPWFGTFYEFGRWLRTNHNRHRWAEWNGRIFHSADMKNDRFVETPGRISELP